MFQPCVDANDIVKGNKGRRIYVNITVLDASKAIKHKVTKKVHNTRLPNSIKQVVAKQASNVAGNRPSGANKVAEKLSLKLVTMIQLKMKEKGITITCKVVFLEGPYFVMQLQVIHCDAVVLAEARDDQSVVGGVDETHSWGIVRWGMDVMGTGPSTKLESDILPAIVHNKLKSSLDEILREKLTEQKVETKVATLPEHKQARYFFDQLEKIHDKEYPQNEVNRIQGTPVQQEYYQDQEQQQHFDYSPKGKKIQPSLLSSTNTLTKSTKAEKQPGSKLERFANLTSKHHRQPSKDDERDDTIVDDTASKIKSKFERFANRTSKHHRQPSKDDERDGIIVDDAASKITTGTKTTATTKMTAITATTSQIMRKVVRKNRQEHNNNIRVGKE
mmetsp:Transcript_9854/g.13887  ORF Transcript_9854/g.13887 Transcript_9854/m.13887 type:complete len:389 (-) Transcript_9854:179-1345(-)